MLAEHGFPIGTYVTIDRDADQITESEADQERSRLEDFATTSGSWFWETDADLCFTYFSPNVFDITGVEAEWHYGKTREDFGIPTAVSRKKWEDHLQRLRDRQPFSDFVFQRVGPDGVKWMRTTGIPVYGSDGVFRGYRGTGTDITSEVTAHESAERLASAIENLDEMLALWDADDRMITCNQRYREINETVSEYTRPGVLFRDHIQAGLDAGLYPSAEGREEAWLEDRLSRHAKPGAPMEMKRQSGQWVLIREQRLADGATLTYSTNISERKKIETERANYLARETEALRALSITDAQQRSTIAVISDGVVMQDADGRIVLSNPAAAEILGLSVDQMAGLTSLDPRWKSIRPDGSDFPGEEHPAMVTLRTGLPQRNVIMGVHKPDGAETWISINSEPILEEGNRQPLATVVTFQDITESRRREAQLTAQAEQLRKFAYLASHDLREPLRKIAVFADFLDEDLQSSDGGDPADYTNRIRDAARRGSSLVENVLRFSTLANETLNREWISLPKAIDEIIAKHNVTGVDINIDLSIRLLRADRKLFEICLSNLIDNALKYASPSRRPKLGLVSTVDSKTQVHEFAVSDNGIGFDPAYKNRVFEPFTRLVAKHDYEGNGIGLSFVKDIVETHGWHIDVDSELDAGTVFRFRIPSRDVKIRN